MADYPMSRVRPQSYKKPRWVKTPGHCHLCGIWRTGLHRDHILPKWKGGSNDPDNIQFICANCHQDKSAEDMKGHSFTKGKKYTKRGPAYVCTPEHKAAIRNALTGVPHSPERIARIKAARIAGNARRLAEKESTT